jgi:transposase
MEALITRKDENHGSTKEVFGGAVGSRHADGLGCSQGSCDEQRGYPSNRRAVGRSSRGDAHWVCTAEINDGLRPGTTTSDAQRIADLEVENRELRRANSILKSASAFFAAELDRPQR